MQLIKLANRFTENRSQEISSITRELKRLAKEIKSPIILLSQLNRNIENRSNKRPLLSDLRESGCISIMDTPGIKNIKKNKLKGSTAKIMNCLSKFYRLNAEERVQISNTKQQHVYRIASQKQSSLRVTHNHKILTAARWQKTDQLKQKNCIKVKNDNQLKEKLIIELNTLSGIRLAYKNTTYDLATHEYCNFSIYMYIVHNSIEQDADLILMLYQDNEETAGEKVDVVIAKHRNGPVGSFRLLFYADNCKFGNIENTNFMDSH